MLKFSKEGGDTILISKITCEARECVHNTDGQCESGMVRVDKFQNNYGAVAFCDSFAKPGSLRAMACGNLPCANAVTSYAGIVRAEEQGLSEENTPAHSDFISCNARDCIYNQSNFCAASRITFVSPEDTDGTLSVCETYERRVF